jgi:hypothetical protein
VGSDWAEIAAAPPGRAVPPPYACYMATLDVDGVRSRHERGRAADGPAARSVPASPLHFDLRSRDPGSQARAWRGGDRRRLSGSRRLGHGPRSTSPTQTPPRHRMARWLATFPAPHLPAGAMRALQGSTPKRGHFRILWRSRSCSPSRPIATGDPSRCRRPALFPGDAPGRRNLLVGSRRGASDRPPRRSTPSGSLLPLERGLLCPYCRLNAPTPRAAAPTASPSPLVPCAPATS